MTLQHLLLVDDSEAVLAYEQAALTSYYLITTATDGAEALRKAAEVKPDAVLLDLSMPGMDGDEVLRKMKADDALKHIPVIIVSSEKARAMACLNDGAVSFLHKPVRADALRAEVGKVLEQAALLRKSGDLGVLYLGVADVEIAVPLSSVDRVLLQPATRTLGVPPSWVGEVVELADRMVPVLDLARVLQVEHAESLVDRKLVVVQSNALQVALCVDRVRDPQDIPSTQVTPRASLVGGDGKALNGSISAVVTSDRGPRALIDPAAFFSRKTLRGLHHGIVRAVASLGAA